MSKMRYYCDACQHEIPPECVGPIGPAGVQAHRFKYAGGEFTHVVYEISESSPAPLPVSEDVAECMAKGATIVVAPEDQIAALKAENEKLKAQLEDIKNATKAAMSETCDCDERHCTCVPLLRGRIKELEAIVKRRDDLLIEQAKGYNRERVILEERLNAGVEEKNTLWLENKRLKKLLDASTCSIEQMRRDLWAWQEKGGSEDDADLKDFAEAALKSVSSEDYPDHRNMAEDVFGIAESMLAEWKRRREGKA